MQKEVAPESMLSDRLSLKADLPVSANLLCDSEAPDRSEIPRTTRYHPAIPGKVFSGRQDHPPVSYLTVLLCNLPCSFASFVSGAEMTAAVYSDKTQVVSYMKDRFPDAENPFS